MGEVDAVVVGAGIAGLHQLHLLRAQGLRVLGIEAAADVGGAWLAADFPGARLDVDAHLYQYFTSETLYRDWSWSERFPGGYEVLRWLRFVADRLDLRRDIRFSTRVVDTVPDGDRWLVRTDAGDTVAARSVVRCTGPVVTTPEPPGLDAVTGTVLRTASWPRRAPDLTGRRVGVVGSGVAAVQLVPAVVGRSAHLTVFARTPVDVLPRHNPMYGWPERERDKARFAALRDALPHTVDGVDDEPVDLGALAPDERAGVLEELYADGSLRLWRAVAARPPDAAVHAEVTAFVRDRMRARIADPRHVDALVPAGHPVGTRPVALDLGWLEVFARDDVTLVDGVDPPDGAFDGLDVVVLTPDDAPDDAPGDSAGDAAPGPVPDHRPGLFTVTAPPPPANGAVDLARQAARVTREITEMHRRDCAV